MVEHAGRAGFLQRQRQPRERRLQQPRQPRRVHVALAETQHLGRQREQPAVLARVAERGQRQQVAARGGAGQAGALGDFLARQVMLPLTPQTITQPDRLRLEIERVRVRGYALVDQELEPGLRTLSVPLRNYRGDVLAALNISAHAGRMRSEELLERCLPMLLEVQAHLREHL